MVHCFILLTFFSSFQCQENPNPTPDDTGLSANYKPSVKLDPKLRRALLRVLTKLDQEDKQNQNEVSIRDINNQIGGPQPSSFEQQPTGPDVVSTNVPLQNPPNYVQQSSSTHTPVAIFQDYAKFNQQPPPSPVAPTVQTTIDFENYYRQYQNQNSVQQVTPESPTSTVLSQTPQPTQQQSTNIKQFSQQDLEAYYKQQNNQQQQQQNQSQQDQPNNEQSSQSEVKNIIPEFVDFNQNFINQDGGNDDKLKSLGYKIIKFDKNDKESINSFLNNNNIEIISTLNGNTPQSNDPLLSQFNIVNQKDLLLSNFIVPGNSENKEILLSSLNINKQQQQQQQQDVVKSNNDIKSTQETLTKSEDIDTTKTNYGLPDPKDNEVSPKPITTEVSPIINKPNENSDVFKTIILSNKVLPDSNSKAIFYNPEHIQNIKNDEEKPKQTDEPNFIPTISSPISSPSSTTSSSIELSNSTSSSSLSSSNSSEVQFFSVPLVAAFTLQQNSFGVPQKVVPLNYLDNGEYISEDRVKSIEAYIELNKQKQKIAESKNDTKEIIDELKIKEKLLEKEKEYVKEKLEQFKQNETKEKLIQQQTIGLQTANLEQYLQKFSSSRFPKFNSDFDNLQFGNNNLELKKSQLQEQFQREAEIERYKKLEYEKIQELNRLEKLKQFEKNFNNFPINTQTEAPTPLIKQTVQLIRTQKPLDITVTQNQPFIPNFIQQQNSNFNPIEFQKSINTFSQRPIENNFQTNQNNFQPVIKSQNNFPIVQPNSFPPQTNNFPNVQPNFTPFQQNNFPQNFITPKVVPIEQNQINNFQSPQTQNNFPKPNNFQNNLITPVEQKQPNFQNNFIQNNPPQPNFFTNQQQLNFNTKPISQPINDFSNSFRPIIPPRENFQNQPIFRTSPASNYITGIQFSQPSFPPQQQGRSNNFLLENKNNFQNNFPPIQKNNLENTFQNFPINQNFPPKDFRNQQQQFIQTNLQAPNFNQPSFFNNRVARKEPFQSIGNFGVNNIFNVPVNTKSQTFKRNIITPSSVLEPPVF